MKLFSIDSPLMVFLGKMADLMWLNVLTLVLCLPIITAGASLTAMHYVCLKIVRDEECYITKSFFKSFKENFAQSTALWLIMLAVIGIFAFDFYIMAGQTVSIANPVRWVIVAIAFIVSMVMLMVFPVQAKFVNPIRITIRNSVVVTLIQFPKVVLMLILYVLPFALGYFIPQMFPIIFLMGVSLPGYCSALLYNKTFKKMEEKYYEANPDAFNPSAGDEHIFSDNVLETEESENDGK